MGEVITREVQLGDVELAMAEAGMGGRPLLLLHGFTGAKEDFTDWLDALGALGWHAVVPDHRGHGESSKPASVKAYSMSILANDSTALVNTLGWDTYTLLGHSMGGFVAQRMAIANPARILGLVLMDTGHGPVDGIDPDQVGLAATIAVESGMETLADLMAETDSPLDTEAHRRLLEDRPGYAQFEDRKLRFTSPYLYASMARELISCPDLLADLSGMDPQPPALVLVGEQDTPFLGSAQRMAGVLSNANSGSHPRCWPQPAIREPRCLVADRKLISEADQRASTRVATWSLDPERLADHPPGHQVLIAKIFMGALAVALPLTSVALLASPASAATKPPPFTGAATGSVSCSAVIKLKFSPPLPFTSGGTTITASGKLGGWTTSGSNVTIEKGKITGTFGGSGTGCDGLATGITSNVNLTISWKGKTTAGGTATLTNSTVVLKGAALSTNGSGDVGFALPNPSKVPPERLGFRFVPVGHDRHRESRLQHHDRSHTWSEVRQEGHDPEGGKRIDFVAVMLVPD